MSDDSHATGSRAAKYRYHVRLIPGYERMADFEAELNYYAQRGWRVVSMDGNRVVFEEALDDE